MNERRRVWRVNLYRLRTRGNGRHGDAVWETYTDGKWFYDLPEPTPERFFGNSRHGDEVVYETEEAAWSALGEQFETWVTETRGVIQRRGVTLPEPKKTRRKKK